MTLHRRHLICALTIAIAGCGNHPPPPAPIQSALLNPGGNFHLLVTNQSFAVSPVDIEVRVDGEVVVFDHFEVGNQHSYKYYRLLLSPGVHDLIISSVRGEAQLAREVTVSGRHWATVAYWQKAWYSGEATPPRFTFTIRDRQSTFP